MGAEWWERERKDVRRVGENGPKGRKDNAVIFDLGGVFFVENGLVGRVDGVSITKGILAL